VIWTLFTLLPLLIPGDPPFVVACDPGDHGEYRGAAEEIARFHGADVVEFEVEELDTLFDHLRALRPAFVTWVLEPSAIDVDLCNRILEQCAALDPDPFLDFEYAFITGRNGEAATAFARRVISAFSKPFARKVGFMATWEGWSLPDAAPASALRALALAGSLELVSTRLSDEERSARVRDLLVGMKGRDALLFMSHGYPDQMVGCFNAKELRDWAVDLSPAILFNCSCYNGAPGRWFDPRNGRFEDRGVVAPEESVALQILDSGVSAYFAGVNPWHGPLAHQVFLAVVDDGVRLGEASAWMFNRLALEFQPDGIHFPPSEETTMTGDDVHNRRRNGAGMIVYGDPSFAPFKEVASRRIRIEILGGNPLRLRITGRPLVVHEPGQDVMLAQSRMMDYYSYRPGSTTPPLQPMKLQMEVYRTLEIDSGSEPPALKVTKASSGLDKIPCGTPQTYLETTWDDRKILHIRVPILESPYRSSAQKLFLKGFYIWLEEENPSSK